MISHWFDITKKTGKTSLIDFACVWTWTDSMSGMKQADFRRITLSLEGAQDGRRAGFCDARFSQGWLRKSDLDCRIARCVYSRSWWPGNDGRNTRRSRLSYSNSLSRQHEKVTIEQSRNVTRRLGLGLRPGATSSGFPTLNALLKPTALKRTFLSCLNTQDKTQSCSSDKGLIT